MHFWLGLNSRARYLAHAHIYLLCNINNVAPAVIMDHDDKHAQGGVTTI